MLTKLLSTIIFCLWASCTWANPNGFLAVATGGAAACNTECPTHLICDKFNNSFDETWTDTGPVTDSFVNESRGLCSTHFVRLTAVGGRYLSIDSGAQTEWYASGWLRLKTDGMSASSTINTILVGTTSSGFTAMSMRIQKNAGGQLQFLLEVNGATPAVTTYDISANTWYHVGMFFQLNGATKNYSWYVSTADTLGTAIASGTHTSSRAPGKTFLDAIVATGTYGNGTTQIDYDSFVVATGGFANVEY